MMTERREDPGKMLLRMLHGGQAPAPPSAPQPSPDQHQSGSSYSATEMMLPSALAASEVRGATAGHGDYGAGPPGPPLNFGYDLPRPGPSVVPATPYTTPSRSAGADLLRMLQQGSPHDHPAQGRPSSTNNNVVMPMPTSQHQHQQPYQYHHHHQQQQQQQQQQPQQQEQQYSSQPPPVPTTRSIAAEQERFLKNFLAIGDNTAKSNSSMSRAAPTTPAELETAETQPPVTYTQLRPTTPPATPACLAAFTSPPATTGVNCANGGGRSKGKDKQGRGSERGRGRENRGERGGERGRGGVTPGSTPGGRRGNRGKAQGRGGQGQGGNGAKEAGRGDAKRGGRGSRGGGKGGRGVSTPQQASYAWSAFQNSPDPKSIPIPSLRNFSLHSEVSEGGGEHAETSSSSDWRSGRAAGESPQQDGNGGQGGYAGLGRVPAGVGQPDVMQTPPPAPRPATDRSSAQKAEDDIKRMLRLG